MNRNDLFSKYTVKVSNGSGCIFDPAAKEYLYVLTAAHNLDCEQLEVMTHTLGDDGLPTENKLEIIGEAFRHPNPAKDAAIIKIRRFAFDQSICITNDLEDFPDEMLLCSYPRIRRKEVYHFREDEIRSINPVEQGYIEARIESNPTFEELDGCSGGGVFFKENKNVFIAGIQSSMATEEDEESLGRVRFMPMDFFQEIVASYPNDLVKLEPAFLVSFSYLSSQAMQLKGCFIDKNVSYVRSYLASLANEIVGSELTPTYIRDLFQERLLIYSEKKTSLSSKALWIAWLEFLMVMRVVHDKLIPGDELENLTNQYRLIFSDTSLDWAEELPNIIRSNYIGLNAGGVVIVGTNTKPAHSVIESGIIPDIINAHNVGKGELRIDEGIGHPLKAYKLIHINAFQELCIIKKDAEYKKFNSLNEGELLQKLKLEYNELFQQP